MSNFWLHCFWLYRCIINAIIWNYPRTTRNNPDRESFALQSLGLRMKCHAVYGLNLEPLTVGNPGTGNLWESSIFTIPCTWELKFGYLWCQFWTQIDYTVIQRHNFAYFISVFCGSNSVSVHTGLKNMENQHNHKYS